MQWGVETNRLSHRIPVAGREYWLLTVAMLIEVLQTFSLSEYFSKPFVPIQWEQWPRKLQVYLKGWNWQTSSSNTADFFHLNFILFQILLQAGTGRGREEKSGRHPLKRQLGAGETGPYSSSEKGRQGGCDSVLSCGTEFKGIILLQ